MSRAELRRQQREKKSKSAVYHLTKEQLDNMLKEQVETVKAEIRAETFALLLTLPCEVLMDHYWKKTYAKKIPEFANYILEYYRMWENDEVSMDDLKADLKQYAGIEFGIGPEE